ncbi:MAG: hypothetical protein JNJ56_12020, partial [Ignavibacteria bacterium]|nr:hypothetical protein [Ignavibacteria bacterium]
VNQDGIIDASDLSLVENDVALSIDGCRMPTDINGDFIVDAGDLSIVENNSTIGLSVITPCSPGPSEVPEKVRMNMTNTERTLLDKSVKEKIKEVSGF